MNYSIGMKTKQSLMAIYIYMKMKQIDEQCLNFEKQQETIDSIHTI